MKHKNDERTRTIKLKIDPCELAFRFAIYLLVALLFYFLTNKPLGTLYWILAIGFCLIHTVSLEIKESRPNLFDEQMTEDYISYVTTKRK